MYVFFSILIFLFNVYIGSFIGFTTSCGMMEGYGMVCTTCRYVCSFFHLNYPFKCLYRLLKFMARFVVDEDDERKVVASVASVLQVCFRSPFLLLNEWEKAVLTRGVDAESQT